MWIFPLISHLRLNIKKVQSYYQKLQNSQYWGFVINQAEWSCDNVFVLRIMDCGMHWQCSNWLKMVWIFITWRRGLFFFSSRLFWISFNVAAWFLCTAQIRKFLVIFSKRISWLFLVINYNFTGKHTPSVDTLTHTVYIQKPWKVTQNLSWWLANA